jgi:hypothetical protein
MKTVRNLVLAFSFLFLLQNTVFAMSIFDIYRSSGVDQNSSAPAAEKEDSLHSVAVFGASKSFSTSLNPEPFFYKRFYRLIPKFLETQQRVLFFFAEKRGLSVLQE